jgi:hypothetical protein
MVQHAYIIKIAKILLSPFASIVPPRSGPEPWFEPNFGPVLTQSGPRSRCQPEPDHDMVLGSGRVRTVLLWFGPSQTVLRRFSGSSTDLHAAGLEVQAGIERSTTAKLLNLTPGIRQEVLKR